MSPCSGLLFYKVGSSLNTPDYETTELDNQSIVRFIAMASKVSMEVENQFDYSIGVYWEDEAVPAKLQMELEPGERVQMTTSLGHVFYATPLSEPETIIDFMAVSGRPEHIFHPSNHLERCEVVHYHDEISFTEGRADCKNMELRYIEFSHANFHEKRLGLNYFQPQVAEPVTKEGFKHIKLPNETFQWLREWYDREKVARDEIEGSSGSCMNQAVAPSTVTHITPDEKKRLAAELQVIILHIYTSHGLKM